MFLLLIFFLQITLEPQKFESIGTGPHPDFQFVQTFKIYFKLLEFLCQKFLCILIHLLFFFNGQGVEIKNKKKQFQIPQ